MSSSKIHSTSSSAAKRYFHTLPWQNRAVLQFSELDLLLRTEWENAFSKDVFLHGVESEPRRMLGRRGFVAVLCRSRASHKRKPQSFTNILQKSEPKSFNFTKVGVNEILFYIEDDTHKKSVTSVVINNSPYEYAHCLLVPNAAECHIQSITIDGIKMGIRVLLGSRHPGFRLMYNSLCAGASVNHLHLHCYYTEYWLPSEAFRMHQIPLKIQGKEFPDIFELEFEDSCVRGFGFVITEENFDFMLPCIIHKIVQYFNGNNIAHNIVMIRGLPPSSGYIESVDAISDENPVTSGIASNFDENPNIPIIKDTGVFPYSGLEACIPLNLWDCPLVGRIYVFPRIPLYGEKSYTKFHVNVTELFGHLYFGDVNIYESMNESDVVDALNGVSFSEQHFAKVKDDIVRVLSQL